MKRTSIIYTSVKRLIILGLTIIVSISLISGIQFYNKLVSEYTEVASSFIQMASYEIEDNVIKSMTNEQNQELIKNIDMSQYINGTLNLPEESAELCFNWYYYNYLLYELMSYNNDLNSFQIFVPDKDKAMCIWRMDNNTDEIYEPFASRDFKYFEQAIVNTLPSYDEKRLQEYIDSNEFIIENDNNKLSGILLQPILDNDKNIIAYIEVSIDLSGILVAIIQLIIRIAFLTIFIIAFALELYFYFTRREILRPVQQLENATSDVVNKLKNDEEIERLDIHTNDEIENLAHSFEGMEENLRKYIAKNNAITAEREHIKAELNLASNIQSDMLIKTFPPFPDRSEFNIYASMNPAKEVGGDFYDFFLIDDNHLALVIADVSGKGVPASLFMMRSMLTIESLASSTYSPAKILGSLNNMVKKNNDSKMFVTVWLGILDIATGILTAANAGHEFPLIKYPGGKFELYKDKHSFIIGGKSNVTYKEYELKLEPGTCLFVYTDGVPEAKNKDNKMFKIDACLDALNKDPDADVETLLHNVSESVSDFVKDAEQFDDLTMLGFEYIGQDSNNNNMETSYNIYTEANLDNINVIIDFICNHIEEIGCDAKISNKIRLAAEEITTNIVSYAYSDTDKDNNVYVTLKISDNNQRITIIFKDNGVPFDPLAKKDPDITLKAKDRKIGGLGIFLTKKIMDTVNYEYKNNQNILTITKLL